MTTPNSQVSRSETEILAKAPITLKFGDMEYSVPILRIGQAREWRNTLIKEVQDIASQLGAEADNSKTFVNGLAFVFLQFPEKIADLVFSYAKTLDRAKIEDEGTEEQLAYAFGKIIQVAFPFVGELRTVTQTLGVMASFPQSAKYTK